MPQKLKQMLMELEETTKGHVVAGVKVEFFTACLIMMGPSSSIDRCKKRGFFASLRCIE